LKIPLFCILVYIIICDDYFTDVSAPTDVGAQRLDNNKAIRVTWLAPTADKIISYDVQYRTIDQDEATTLSVNDLNDLSLIITGLSDLSNYEVRVRANFEAGNSDTLAIVSGPWSAWVESRVNNCCKSVSVCVRACMCIQYISLLYLFYHTISLVCRCSRRWCHHSTQWSIADSIHIIIISCSVVFLDFMVFSTSSYLYYLACSL